MTRYLGQFREQCRHFNGIQHDTCEAGVPYLSVRDDSAPGPYRWPCLDVGRGLASTICPKQSLLTKEEKEEWERTIDGVIAKADADIAAGKCHVCGANTEPSKVVGRCRYAACGHRIGQVATEDWP